MFMAMKEPTKSDAVPLPANLNLCLTAHAHDRHVSKRRLIRDILQCWAASVTDWNHPRWRDSLLPIEPVKMAEERWPGYIDSLVLFTPVDIERPAFPGLKLGTLP
jgi:hypothetical protein